MYANGRLATSCTRARVGLCALLAAVGVAGALATRGSPSTDATSACAGQPWMNSALTPDQRVDSLLPRMTLSDKTALVHGVNSGTDLRNAAGGYTGYVPENTRLCIPALKLQDGPAGVARMRGVTALPSPLAAAATWDTALMTAYGDVIGSEMWGKGANVALGPMVNLVRVPQAGRNFESFGEDPYLASRLADASVRGVQGAGVIATVKHLAANEQETNRFVYSAEVDQRTLHEIYLPAFEAAVRNAGAGAVMAAYNKLNGGYCTENADLLTRRLKRELAFGGFAMSDWGATHSTVAAANAGLDLEMPTGAYFGSLGAAVTNGSVSAATLDDKVRRILRQMFRFGLFDRVQTGTASTPVTSADHVAVARRTAAAGTVLLKNQAGFLPLKLRTGGVVAVIGPYANAVPAGGGSSQVTPTYAVSPLAGLRARAGPDVTALYADGSDRSTAAALAAKADLALVFVGAVDSEGVDRTSLALPNDQDGLIRAVASANPRTGVVLQTGGPVLMPWLDRVAAVAEAWYPGQEDGSAIASVLFGDVDATGRLPVTFPRSASDTPTATAAQYPGVNNRVSYSEGVFVGYRHYDQRGIQPLFPFGAGLSYTTFGYRALGITPSTTIARAPATIRVSATIANTGARPGTETVQLYVGIPSTAVPEPPKQLRGFAKVALAPGQSKAVTFTLTPRDLSYWNTSPGRWSLAPGTYSVMLGSSSRWIRLRGSFTVT